MKKQFRRLSCVFLFATLVITGFAWMGGARTALAITPITLCYVDISVLVSGSGTSWGDPYKYLQDALADATCQEILVAKGIYYPDEGTGQTNDQRTSTFLLKNRVAIYGGYPTGGAGSRDWLAHPTILSGDLDKNDTTLNGVITDTAHITGNNAYHVVTGSITASTAVLDGFTITAGWANGSDTTPCNQRCGGGMYNFAGDPTLNDITITGNLAYEGGGIYNFESSPTLTNVTISSNKTTYNGAGMYNYSSSSPTLTDVTIADNQAYNYGGGVSNFDNSNPTLVNVMLVGNRAYGGGGMYSYNSNPTITNVAIAGNVAELGGGMYNYGSSPILINVKLVGNRAYQGGGMFNFWYSSPILTNVTIASNQATYEGGGLYNYVYNDVTIRNGIVWGNAAPNDPQIYNLHSTSTFAYSLVEGCNPSGTWNSACGTDGGNNLADADPLFVAPEPAANAPTTVGNYRLQAGSPAIDAGNDPLNTTTTDLDGNPRIAGVAIDLGAYEVPTYHDLTVVLGYPAGVVTSTDTLINCGSTCTERYPEGTVVTLTATPDIGANFLGWDGAGCSGTGPCIVTITETSVVTANFAMILYGIDVYKDGPGTGTVVSDPNLINCGSSCSQLGVFYGDVVTLTATADPGSVFAGWSGECNGTGACVLTIDESNVVTATFDTSAVTGFGQIYLSSTTGGTIGSVTFAKQDIVSYDGATWSLSFDGSDVGLGNTGIDALHVLEDGGLLLSFTSDVRLSGLGGVSRNDIVRFTPTSLGETTSGTFSWYFDASDVGYAASSEDLDALALFDGKLVFSTAGNFAAPGVSGMDDDLIAFTPTNLGSNTAGSSALSLKGMLAGLGDLSTEDIKGLWVAPNGDLYLANEGNFTMPGLNGNGKVVFICTPTGLSCTPDPALFFDGNALGFPGNISALHVVP